MSLANTSQRLNLLEGFFGTMIGVDRLNGGRHCCCREVGILDKGEGRMSPMEVGTCKLEDRQISGPIFN